MAYTGRSGRCQTCRDRKVKCDETRPTCQRCVKARRVCGGYERRTRLIFRNQNDTLGKRRPRERTGEKPAPAKGLRQSIVWDVVKSTAASPISKAVDTPLQQRALCRFLHDFVKVYCPPTTANSGDAFHDFLPVLFKTARDDSCLRAAVLAAAMANLGNRSDNPDWRKEARDMYADALRKTDAALASPSDSRRDETLVSIYVLAMYEYMTCTRQTIGHWYSHIIGSAATMEARGPETLQTPLGRRLFAHHRVHWIVVSFQMARLIFPFGEQWRIPGQEHDPESRLVEILAKVPDLIGAAKALKTGPHSSPSLNREAILHLEGRALEVEAELEWWRQSLPPSWLPVVIDPDAAASFPPSEVYQRHLHVYSDVATGSMWNHFRVARIVLCWILGKCSTLPFADFFDEDEVCATYDDDLVAQLVTDICASIPFLLGYRFDDDDDDDDGDNRVRPPSEAQKLQGYRSATSIWHCYVASVIPPIPEDQKKWLRGRLRFIAGTAGLKIADALSQADINFPDVDDCDAWNKPRRRRVP